MKTKVIFRKYKKEIDSFGSIVALFFEEKNNDGYIETYEHVGQHSYANFNYMIEITETISNEKEYNKLKKELENIGYNLEIKNNIII